MLMVKRFVFLYLRRTRSSFKLFFLWLCKVNIVLAEVIRPTVRFICVSAPKFSLSLRWSFVSIERVFSWLKKVSHSISLHFYFNNQRSRYLIGNFLWHQMKSLFFGRASHMKDLESRGKKRKTMCSIVVFFFQISIISLSMQLLWCQYMNVPALFSSSTLHHLWWHTFDDEFYWTKKNVIPIVNRYRLHLWVLVKWS
jgi:hypothetical protein